jgi:hypothetical protein
MELDIKKIEDYLESVKISARQFCIQIGLSYSAWNTIKDRKRISVKSLQKIATYMNVDPSELFVGYVAPETKPVDDSDEMKFIVQRMKDFMVRNKIHYQELAELIHVPYRTLKYQISNSCVSTGTLAAISKVFTDVNVGWFFSDSIAYERQTSSEMAAEPKISYSAESKILQKLDDIQKLIEKKL